MNSVLNKKLKEILFKIQGHKLWLDKDPEGKRAEFSSCDLSGLDLSHLDLSYINFTKCNLQNTNLTGSCCRGSHFVGANLKEANLTGSDFTDAHMHHADLTKTILINTIFYNTDLREANLTDTGFIIWQINNHTIWYCRGYITINGMSIILKDWLKDEIALARFARDYEIDKNEFYILQNFAKICLAMYEGSYRAFKGLNNESK